MTCIQYIGAINSGNENDDCYLIKIIYHCTI